MSATPEAHEPAARYLAPPLLRHFDLVAQASGGVARLRELILTLAVQGKLVPQDPADEPASVLLERIREEKARLVKEGKIRKEKPLPTIAEEEKPFALPEEWEWVRLGAITNFGSTIKAAALSDDTWVLDLEDVEKGSGRLIQRVRFSDRRSLSDKNCFSVGDVLYGKLRPYLNKVLVADEDGVCTTEIIPFRCYGPYIPDYFRIALSSPYFLDYVNVLSYGMKMPRLGTDDARKALIPLPPLAEQSRIVARVEELMALCDALEEEGRLEAAQHERLSGVLFDALANSASAEEAAENWQRIAPHFDLLLDRPAAVDRLEHTILQLAVRGRLVPQDPADEPASALLQKIRAEKDPLIAAGKLKHDKPLPLITTEEKPFDIPGGWEWVFLRDLIPEFQNGASSRGDVGGKPITVLRLADIRNRRISLHDTREIPINEWDARKYGLLKGDILIVRVNGSADIIGQFILNDADLTAIYCDHFIRMRIDQSVIAPSFLSLFGESSLARSRIQSLFITTAGQKTVNQGHIGSLLLPLPPLAEQSRIVACVAELRGICAQLRNRLAATTQTRFRLAEALLEQAVA